MALVAGVLVIGASVIMEREATSLGAELQIPEIVIGGLVLAAVTSLPNAVAGAYLASRGRGVATLSTAFNSNAFNVIAGLLGPAAILGLGAPSASGTFVAGSYLALTVAVAGLAWMGHGLDRRAGVAIIAAYGLFATVLALS